LSPRCLLFIFVGVVCVFEFWVWKVKNRFFVGIFEDWKSGNMDLKLKVMVEL
jgi:hypothetical protein